MKKMLILVAGPPATGKSYLINKMRTNMPDFFMISPDKIKELFADKFGFNNLAEKAQLEQKVWQFYYDILQKYMWIGETPIVTEYPFSDKQKQHFTNLASKYDYHIITIRLICDFDTLWQRRHTRDLQQNRHLSHIASNYHHSDTLADRKLADNHITKAEFKQLIDKRGYNEFSLGELYEVDVTDYNHVNYKKLITTVMKSIQTG